MIIEGRVEEKNQKAQSLDNLGSLKRTVGEDQDQNLFDR